MTVAPEAAELWNVISVIGELSRAKSAVSPGWMATEAMQRIDFPRGLHPVGYIGCHLTFRQIAREYLRKKFDPAAIAAAATDDQLIFPETLQERYPLKPKPREEPVYVLLSDLPDVDLFYNVRRMRAVALALQKHADALETYGINRRGVA
jgi:hypothetical protein